MSKGIKAFMIQSKGQVQIGDCIFQVLEGEIIPAQARPGSRTTSELIIVYDTSLEKDCHELFIPEYIKCIRNYNTDLSYC